jgi:Histidine kinase
VLQALIEICTSDRTLLWTVLLTDLSIAVAYFAIPITMAVVLRHRRADIPYPWLWTLFVTFIVACGLTHVVHVMSAVASVQFLGWHAAIGIVTALASVGTAIAFMFVLPQIKNLPSPAQQREALAKTVAERTKQKDKLIREINHRVGNQLQILSSIVNIESRKTDSSEVHEVLGRLRQQIDDMAADHINQSKYDYLQEWASEGVPRTA